MDFSAHENNLEVRFFVAANNFVKHEILSGDFMLNILRPICSNLKSPLFLQSPSLLI